MLSNHQQLEVPAEPPASHPNPLDQGTNHHYGYGMRSVFQQASSLHLYFTIRLFYSNCIKHRMSACAVLCSTRAYIYPVDILANLTHSTVNALHGPLAT